MVVGVNVVILNTHPRTLYKWGIKWWTLNGNRYTNYKFMHQRLFRGRTNGGLLLKTLVNMRPLSPKDIRFRILNLPGIVKAGLIFVKG